jgi:hypothetical protein
MLVAGFAIAAVRYETAISGTLDCATEVLRTAKRVSDWSPALPAPREANATVFDVGQLNAFVVPGVGVDTGVGVDDTGGVLLPPPPPQAASESPTSAAVSVRKRASSLKLNLPVR